MAFKDKVQTLLNKVKNGREGGQQTLLSNRADGSYSGYTPKITRRTPEMEQMDRTFSGFAGMMPGGVSMPQQFQAVGGQTGNMPQTRQAGTAPQAPVQPAPGIPQQQAQPTGFQPRMQLFPQQQMQQTGYQPRPQAAPQQQAQPMGFQPRPQAAPQQQAQPMGFQPRPQAAPQQQAQPTGFQPRPQGFPQQAQTAPVQPDYLPGSYVDQNGSVYRIVIRVAQITGVASCYRLIEFMQNNEAMIVNAEQITDPMEVNRCMDLLFGAAYAMEQNFVRVSGKMIYLITPPQVQVSPFDSLRRMSEDDMERRWPGANRAPYQQQEPVQFASFAAAQQRHDFAAAGGRHAARSAQAGAYTDFGGYSARR
ncbi:MAG: cell division protein SepF [Clostridia bacterium]|nr:cell division protein SepF [Clostridia bacterium]